MGQFMEKTDTFMQKRLFAVMLGVALALATYAGDCFEGMRSDNDSTHHRVLIFGDSTLDGVARRFAGYALENGYSIYSSVWYGATVKDWAYTTELHKLMQKVHPTFVVVSLGTNDLGYNDISARAEAVREILREIGNVPFVWIGPISLKAVKKDFGIVNMIRDNVGANHFYNSYNLKLSRLPDGIHPTFQASASWVDGVARWMNSSDSICPLPMARPKTVAKQFKHNERHTRKYKGVRK